MLECPNVDIRSVNSQRLQNILDNNNYMYTDSQSHAWYGVRGEQEKSDNYSDWYCCLYMPIYIYIYIYRQFKL